MLAVLGLERGLSKIDLTTGSLCGLERPIGALHCVPFDGRLLTTVGALPTLTDECWPTDLNRRVPSRTHGGAAGVGGRPPPLCRS